MRRSERKQIIGAEGVNCCVWFQPTGSICENCGGRQGGQRTRSGRAGAWANSSQKTVTRVCGAFFPSLRAREEFAKVGTLRGRVYCRCWHRRLLCSLSQVSSRLVLCVKAAEAR